MRLVLCALVFALFVAAFPAPAAGQDGSMSQDRPAQDEPDSMDQNSDQSSDSPPPKTDAEAQRREAARCQQGFENGTYSHDAPPARDDPCHRYYEYWQERHNETARQEAQERQRREIERHQAAYRERWDREQDDALWKQRWQEARDGHEKLQRVPEANRDRVGALVPADAGYRGTFVAFVPDRATSTLSNVSLSGTTLFVAVELPGAANAATTKVAGNLLRVDGHSWRFHLVDSPGAVMVFHADEEPFVLTLPAAATVTWSPRGADLVYERPGSEPVRATLRGDVTPDGGGNRLLITGEARFLAEASRTIHEAVANRHAAELDEAAVSGRLGAEVAVMKGADAQTLTDTIVDDTILYADLDVVVDRATDADAPKGRYTITVDSDTEPGKTIAVAFEAGMLDADGLQIRYFNVDADRVVEAPVVEASSLADVLDPLDDGVVAEYRIVEDADGVQLLLSIPHFSTHRFEVSSLDITVLEEPSVVLGAIAAGALVVAAAAAMMRRPRP